MEVEEGRWSWIMLAIACRTWLCPSSYCRRSSASLQLFRTWIRFWSGWWQSGRTRWRLALWGRTSWVALRTNLNTCCGRDWMDLAQVDAASGVAILIIWPCRGRPLRFSSRLSSSSIFTFLMDAIRRALLVWDGSSFIASCTTIAGRNFFLLLAISDLRFSSAMNLTVGSADVSSWHCLDTWRHW